ncbi:hypothetical protein HU147_18500 [Planomicrobium chinense]|uniref:hypothetical protein n=1 Tax=Planococcus chinensis TaxID=272917 RepID=UPI001CC75A3D|nr:hypothetical protein [Planococcus chinensis]MBZ5203197.1 hypothetical protein [Planococcus chinensis]
MAKEKSYVVVHDFTDLQDKNKIYRTGDTYPSPANKKISEKRLNELASKDNKQGIQVIRAVESSTEDKK